MNRTRYLSLVSLLSLSLIGCSSTTAPASVSTEPATPKTPVEQKPPVQVIKELTQDFNADGKPDKLTLQQKNGPKSEPLGWVLLLNDKPEFDFDTMNLTYTYADIEAQDLDSDGVPEILFYRRSSGSAGETGLNIFRHSQGGWWQIFEQTQHHYGKVMQKYIGNYQVRFRDELSGIEALIPLDPAKYAGYKTDAEREAALNKIYPWVDPVSDFRFQDIDNDGVKEIIAIRRVIGIAHADTIARLNTTYKLKKGSFYPLKISLISEKGGKVLAEKPI